MLVLGMAIVKENALECRWHFEHTEYDPEEVKRKKGRNK